MGLIDWIGLLLLGFCVQPLQIRDGSILLGQKMSGPVFSRLLTCGEHTPTKATFHGRLLQGLHSVLQFPWRLWLSMPPASVEGWGPESDVGQFALLQGYREAYANVPLVVGLSFEKQSREHHPKSGCVHGAPRKVGALGDQLHCRLQALMGSGMSPATSCAQLQRQNFIQKRPCLWIALAWIVS